MTKVWPQLDNYPSHEQAIDGVYSTTAPLYYEGPCVGGPLDGQELRSTGRSHYISVPVGRGHNPAKSPDYYTGRFALKEYAFLESLNGSVFGKWVYRG